MAGTHAGPTWSPLQARREGEGVKARRKGGSECKRKSGREGGRQ